MLPPTRLLQGGACEGAGGALGDGTQRRFSGIVCGWRCTGDAARGRSRSRDLLLPLPVEKWWCVFDCSALEDLRRNTLKEKSFKGEIQ